MQRLVRILAAGAVAAMAGAMFPLFGASMQDGEDDLYTYDLSFRWNLTTWYGPEGATPEEALKGEGPSAGGTDVFDTVTAVYGWNAGEQRWLGFFPDAIDVPGANDLEALHFAEAYWIAINAEDGAQWSIVTDGNFIPEPTPTVTATPTETPTATPTATATPAPETVTVDLLSTSFDPSHVEIDAGSSVEFVWQTGFHNVVSENDEEGEKPLPEEFPTPASGATFTVTFDEPGTYPFVCQVHASAGMRGEVIVN